MVVAGMSRNSRSRPFLGMKAFDSHSQIMGMDLFILSHFLTSEMLFFIPFPCPNFGNVFFYSHPISKSWEWIFLHSLPVSEFAISQAGIIMGIGILWEITDYQDVTKKSLRKNGTSEWAMNVTHWLVVLISRRCYLLYLKKHLFQKRALERLLWKVGTPQDKNVYVVANVQIQLMYTLAS